MTQQNKYLIKRIIVEVVIFAVLLASDLISKDIIFNRFSKLGVESYHQYILIDGLFAIYPCTNDGASFSIFSGKTEFLIALTAILMIAMAVIMIINIIKKPHMSWLFRWSMLLIISGGVGNLYDRLFCDGEVRDFIQYLFLDKIWQTLFDSSFGIGNVADIYLVLGVFLVCVYIVFDYKEGDLGLMKPKLPKNVRPDEVPVEDSLSSLENNIAEDEAADCQIEKDTQDNQNSEETKADLSKDEQKEKEDSVPKKKSLKANTDKIN